MLDTHACFQAEPPLIGVIELRRRLATLDAARTPALDVERLARAIRNALWPNWVNEPDRPSLFWHADAAKVAAEYDRLAALATPPEPGD